MFVRWSCGCKGLIVAEVCWVIDPCDGEGEGLCLYERNMTDSKAVLVGRKEYDRLTKEEQQEDVPKSYVPLSYEDTKKYLEEMSRLMDDGHSFRLIQMTLSRKREARN